MSIISPSPSSGTTPLSTRSPSPFHLSNKDEETCWGDQDSRGSPMTPRSPSPGPSESTFHQSSKKKGTRWDDRDFRGPPLTSRSHLPGSSGSTFHQSRKEKETRWGDQDSRGPPLTSRSPSTFHQSRKEKETRWGDQESRSTPRTSRSHLPAVAQQYPRSRQSDKEKENHSRDDRNPRLPDDRYVRKRVSEPDFRPDPGMDSSKKRRNGIKIF